MILKVFAKKDGFRRAGFVFREKDETLIDTDKLPEDTREATIKALMEEPMLVVYEAGKEPKKATDFEKENKALKKEIEALSKKVEELTAALSASEDKKNKPNK